MTADPNLAVQLGGILATAHANDMTHQETAAMLVNALQPCIATALREARNAALEEAAVNLERAAYSVWDGKKRSNEIDRHTHYLLLDKAAQTRALKHKDGQP